MTTLDDIIVRGGERLGLSPQQVRIAVLLAGGLASKEIGRKIHLTRRTVDTYIQRAFAKLKIDNRVALVVMCVQAGLSDGDHCENPN